MNEYINDFEKWCADCVTITDKETGEQIPFRLNAPQRRVLGVMEQMRKEGKPIRLIMLKARQWGGSTLIQTYMAWMQLVRRTGWSSIICGHVRDASSNIQGMYSRLLREYPDRLKEGKPKDWTFVPYEKSHNISYIPARDCRVAVATALSPDGIRGGNFSMAHLSEVAFWGDGDWATANKIVRSVAGSIVRLPDTIIVMESTANGEDNYFHHEWQRAVAGESDKTPVFVAWHEIEIYTREVADEERESLLESFDDYEHRLLADGVSLEHVAWYHDKRREYVSHAAMMAEYPSTPDEAFETSAKRLFSADDLAGLCVCDTSLSSLRTHLTVIYPTDSVNIVCHAGITAAGIRIHSDLLMPIGSLRDTLEAARKRLSGGELVIVHNPAEESPHAGWFAAAARRGGLPLWCDDDGNSVFELSKMQLSEIIDSYKEALHGKLISEYSKKFVLNLATLRQPISTLLLSRSSFIDSEHSSLPASGEVHERFTGAVLIAHALAVHLLLSWLDNAETIPSDFY